ncbi:peroxiredoxin-like family protein [Marinobacter salicampi]|uniref:peroxiredoxin-like family protein n=1 Tax=Marinobacter salicampi TaxID=435907 RepID=UPI00140D3B16|nr:peroxiredoxin-like family protein [Marinobacter salicampi]
MTHHAKVGGTFPQISVAMLDENQIQVGRPTDGKWQLVVVYRGLHCPICKKYLGKLETMKGEFEGIDVEVVAISTDPEQKARKFRDGSELTLPIGYGLSRDDARALGLFISEPISSAETDQQFAEPGTYVITPDGKLQIMDVSNAPFSRPDLEMLKSGIEFIQQKDYPVRGAA